MKRVVPAVTRSLDILELFLEADGPLSSSDIVAQLELPRTTVHELLGTLEARSYLSRARGDPRRYELGFRLLQLGSVYSDGNSLIDAGRAIATEVSRRCNETVHLAVLENRDIVYIAKAESTQAVRMASAVGRRLPAHCTAVGKILLANLAEPQLDALYDSTRPLVTLTSRSIATTSALKEELAKARTCGFAEDLGESQEDVCCVAARVRSGSGETVAGLSISVPASRWSAAGHQQLLSLVLEGASTLSHRLGYSDGTAERPS